LTVVGVSTIRATRIDLVMTSTKQDPGYGGCWPTTDQELLLQAAVLDGSDAIESWRRWCANWNIDDLNPRSLHLLPQIYRNLQNFGSAVPEFNRLKGIYRYTWYGNQEWVREIVPVLEALHDAGVAAIVLRDLALISAYYRDFGQRPVQDASLFIRPNQLSLALEQLRSIGWRTNATSLQRLTQFRSSTVVWKPGAKYATLHWRVFDKWLSAEQEEQILNAAVSVRIANTSALCLCPVDQLLQICGYGVRYDVLPPTEWVVDAITVLRTSGETFDWSRFIIVATNACITQPIHDALTYLREHFPVDIPDSVVQDLNAAPRSRLEQSEYAVRLQEPKLWNRLQAHWYQHVDMTNGQGLPRTAMTFPLYLQCAWNLRHVWDIPVRAGRASFRGSRSS
jgi:Uncharacterised nucleotidyltransferase